MARFVSDQNQVGMFFESGTYGNISGTLQWIGLVQNHDIDEETNVDAVRFLGNASRNVGQFVDGPLGFKGKLSYFPQDWRLLGFAMGSIVDTGSPSPYQHDLAETNSNNGNAFTSGVHNPFLSFAIEDTQTVIGTGLNFKRTMVGCTVDRFKLTGEQGEILTAEVDYIAQSGTYASGAATAITATTTRPYHFHDVVLHIPSGTRIASLKKFEFELANNLEATHYAGSRVIGPPLPIFRDYNFPITIDAMSENAKIFYDQYFLGGSTFNALLAISASTGSREVFITMSGCKLMNMDAPSPTEGVNEQVIEIKPQSCTGIVNDLVQLYNAWGI